MSWLRHLHPRAIVRRMIVRAAGGRVVSGPFQGMGYALAGHEFLPYLLGTYECELHEVVEQICRVPFDTIVNIGAAGGYYAVGLARRIPGCRVVAFEIDPEARQLAADLASDNGVADRIEWHGLCDASGLVQALSRGGRTLVVMDVEGAEAILLDPFLAPALRQAQVLLEVHDVAYREMGTLIAGRFAGTHNRLEVWSRPRTAADFPLPLKAWKRKLLAYRLRRAMNERRCETMRWFYLTPKAAPG
jgi:predicted RNA methylase